MGVRQRLLELIDRSGVSGRRLSLLATGTIDTVRNMRRGSTPRLDSLDALCRVLGFRLEMVPLDEPGQPPEGPPLLRDGPSGPGSTGRKSAGIWSRSSAGPAKGGAGRIDRGRPTGENPGHYRSSDSEKVQHRGNAGLFFPGIRADILVPPQGRDLVSPRRESLLWLFSG